MYLDVASQVKDALKGKHVALTTDGWTSKATQSYNTIMCVHTSFKTAFRSEKEVPQLYLDVASQVKDALKGNYVALTTDGWTSKATQSYITIMCVHINSDRKVQNFVLHV